MGIFDKIRDAILGGGAAASKTATAPVSTDAKSVTASTSARQPAASSSAPKPVDVAAILDAAVKKSGRKLNWRTSIVDLMKALNLDSSLANRKELAKELGYTGNMKDSAAINTWLHRQVIRKLKESGGKVPADLA